MAGSSRRSPHISPHLLISPQTSPYFPQTGAGSSRPLPPLSDTWQVLNAYASTTQSAFFFYCVLTQCSRLFFKGTRYYFSHLGNLIDVLIILLVMAIVVDFMAIEYTPHRTPRGHVACSPLLITPWHALPTAPTAYALSPPALPSSPSHPLRRVAGTAALT